MYLTESPILLPSEMAGKKGGLGTLTSSEPLGSGRLRSFFPCSGAPAPAQRSLVASRDPIVRAAKSAGSLEQSLHESGFSLRSKACNKEFWFVYLSFYIKYKMH